MIDVGSVLRPSEPQAARHAAKFPTLPHDHVASISVLVLLAANLFEKKYSSAVDFERLARVQALYGSGISQLSPGGGLRGSDLVHACLGWAI